MALLKAGEHKGINWIRYRGVGRRREDCAERSEGPALRDVRCSNATRPGPGNPQKQHEMTDEYASSFPFRSSRRFNAAKTMELGAHSGKYKARPAGTPIEFSFLVPSGFTRSRSQQPLRFVLQCVLEGTGIGCECGAFYPEGSRYFAPGGYRSEHFQQDGVCLSRL